VASQHQPFDLMRRAGFVDVDVVDQTEQFRTTQAAWIDEWHEHRDVLVALHGESDYETRQQERRNQLQATEDGLLQRSLAVGAA
jgi:cupin superfamily acireductone dioxygenase involved in methionine salvage